MVGGMSTAEPSNPYLSGRYGMTIPIDRVPLGQQRDWIVELEGLGYTDVWSSEANTTDAFTPLALASAWAPSLRLGTAIVPAYTRGPALLAQSVASMADAAPGRFAFGIGSSSHVIVEGWNGIPFEDPYLQVRDMVRFVRESMTGEKVSGSFGRSEVKGFRLGFRPESQPTILIAALREGMLRLAGREADGAILNWLSADDVSTVAPIVNAAAGEGSRPGAREIVARIFVAPTTDRDTVMAMGRYAIAAYLSVPVYAAFHRWLGREEDLSEMWRLWEQGDRQGALAAIPDRVVEDLIIWGSPDQCRDHILRYVDNGVTTPVLAMLPVASDIDHHRRLIRELAPR